MIQSPQQSLVLASRAYGSGSVRYWNYTDASGFDRESASRLGLIGHPKIQVENTGENPLLDQPQVYPKDITLTVHQLGRDDLRHHVPAAVVIVAQARQD